jgi:5'-nucleotidase
VATSLLLGSASSSALNIALTNDDGWSSVGIQSLFAALVAAGHTVTLAGPLDEQSGSSGAINLGELVIVKQAENVFSVALAGGEEGAEPATAGAVATHISTQLTGQAPDILISGINDGANLSAATQHSGTVGAATLSLGQFSGGSVPAIAVSTDGRCEEMGTECDEVADFIVDYLAHLENRPNYVKGRTGLLPDRVGLNINYPPGDPLGVKLARQGWLPLLGGSSISIDIGCQLDDCNSLAIGESGAGGIIGATAIEGADRDLADSDLFVEGYITVVPIRPDYTVNPKGFKRYLEEFEQ